MPQNPGQQQLSRLDAPMLKGGSHGFPIDRPVLMNAQSPPADGARRTWLKRLMILPPILLGGAVLAFLVTGREPPARTVAGETTQPVRTIAMEPLAFVPRAIGYGTVEPGTVWEAVAEIPGTVIERHPELERGQLIEAGTVILRLDPTDYELAVARIAATLDSIAAEMEELEARQANLRASLEIERRAVDLAERELARARQLLARGTASQSRVDEAEQTLLSQRQRVQELENELNLIPARRRVLEANRQVNRVERDQAERDLARTDIAMPFDGRIAEVQVETAEYVAAGQVMAVADGIDVAEITAQVALVHMAPLIPRDIDPSQLPAPALARLPERLGIAAEIRLDFGDRTARWPARLDRISETIDAETRTLGVIVQVDDPLRRAIPGQRPPLTKGMYVAVELQGEPRPGTFVVPRVALHRREGAPPLVYVVDEADRLAFRAVTPGPEQDDLVVIEDGLQAGDRVVVSDLVPAIEGMQLSPRRDEALAEALRARATADDAASAAATAVDSE